MNCFTVLGIDYGADERQVKRAYAALLKLHHPEDEPEKFREIRTAYESALSIARQSRSGAEPVEMARVVVVSVTPQRTPEPVIFEKEAGGVAPTLPSEPVEWLEPEAEERDTISDPVLFDSADPFTERVSLPSTSIPYSPPLTVAPAKLASEFHVELRECLDRPDRYRAELLFRHGAMRSLEAKESLFFSVFEELTRYASTTTKPFYELLFRLDELFQWSADEIRLTRKYPKQEATRVFELLLEKQRRRLFQEARLRARAGLRWHITVHVASLGAFGVGLLCWSLIR